MGDIITVEIVFLLVTYSSLSHAVSCQPSKQKFETKSSSDYLDSDFFPLTSTIHLKDCFTAVPPLTIPIL